MNANNYKVTGGPVPKDGPSTADSPPRRMGKTTIGGVSGRFSKFSTGITIARGQRTPKQASVGYHRAD